ncbi:UNVERIFIED_CONTAM: putative clathrin assembly protein [Sesamum calycinum]|uniref:Clathrin assembly protein n=1 Tax=Sesamum calycinum TaxID=2727403 RepID=A0AAW2ITG3_9LAMI
MYMESEVGPELIRRLRKSRPRYGDEISSNGSESERYKSRASSSHGPAAAAIGAVKDQTSIGIAKVASNMAPELEVAIVKATSHDDDPASEKYIREILQLTSYSRGYVSACVVAVSKRLGKTRDWIVALKCLMLIHRLLIDGDAVFQQEIMYATRRGTRLLNLSDFRDEAHSNSWDHSAFVRTYALYLDQRLELMVYERKQSGNGGEIERFGGSRDDRYIIDHPRIKRGYDYDYNEHRGARLRNEEIKVIR